MSSTTHTPTEAMPPPSSHVGPWAWLNAAPTGSRNMPHFGHFPGPACRTSGCMGQVYSVAAVATACS